MLGSHSLLVFTNNNMLYTNPVAGVVREVSARYRDCNKTVQAQDLVTRLRKMQFKECEVEREPFEMQGPVHCQLKSFSIESNDGPACRQATWHNVTDTCSLGDGGGGEVMDEEIELLLEEVRAERRNINKFINLNSWVGGDSVHVKDDSDNHDSESEDILSGLSCRDNRTLSIYLVDPGQGGFQGLADALGVQQSDHPTLVIVSPQEETVVEVRAEGNSFRRTLEELIVAWHDGEVVGQPGLRSSDRGGNLHLGADSSCDSYGDDVSCVREITRDSFQADVLNSSSSTVLFYTSSFCSHCTAVSHIFHAVSRLLGGVGGVQFRMVDATRNDLPWQFTALAYPTVIFFPQQRKENSRVFPTYKELNTTNLLAFIVSNLSPEVRLKLALKSCDTVCLAKVRLSAMDTLSNFERLARRRSIMGRRGAKLQHQIKYAKTVLYVVSAWVDNPDQELPQVSDRYFSAIIDSFVEARGR